MSFQNISELKLVEASNKGNHKFREFKKINGRPVKQYIEHLGVISRIEIKAAIAKARCKNE